MYGTSTAIFCTADGHSVWGGVQWLFYTWAGEEQQSALLKWPLLPSKWRSRTCIQSGCCAERGTLTLDRCLIVRLKQATSTELSIISLLQQSCSHTNCEDDLRVDGLRKKLCDEIFCFCLMRMYCSLLWPFWVASFTKGRVKKACFNLYGCSKNLN